MLVIMKIWLLGKQINYVAILQWPAEERGAPLLAGAPRANYTGGVCISVCLCVCVCGCEA